MSKFLVFILSIFMYQSNALVSALDVASAYTFDPVPVQSNIQKIDPVKPESNVNRLMRMEELRSGVTSVEVQFGIAATVDGKSISFAGTLVGTSDNKTRIKINYSIVNLIDFRNIQDKVFIMFPRKELAFDGAVEGDFSRILNSSAAGLRMLFPDMWEPKATGRRYFKENTGREVVVVYNGTKILRKIVVEKREDDYVVSKIFVYDDDQVLRGIATYSDYADMGGHLIPNKIVMQFSYTTTFVFTISKVNFNKNPKEEVFNRPELPDGTRLLPMENMQEIGIERLLKE